MKKNVTKIAMILASVSMFSGSAFAAPILASTKPTLTVKGSITAVATLALGTSTAQSGQTQTLTFPFVTGVAENAQPMDGAQGGATAGLVVSDNDNNGWTIKADSLNAGKMKGAATSLLIPYNINVDGAAVASLPLTSAATPATINLSTGSGGLTPVTGEVHVLTASHTALPSTQAADAYQDVVTFYLYSL